MGWLSYEANYYKDGKIDIIEEVKHSLDNPLKLRKVGSTVYAACQLEDGCIVAGIILTKTARNKEIAIKVMDESMGPYEDKCPKSILDMLSPLDETEVYAKEWRERCYNNLKKKNTLKDLPYGTVIKFEYWDGVRFIIKRPPNHQFKTDWFQCCTENIIPLNTYFSKKNIPQNYEIIE